jgi:hypothetical protein
VNLGKIVCEVEIVWEVKTFKGKIDWEVKIVKGKIVWHVKIVLWGK